MKATSNFNEKTSILIAGERKGEWVALPHSFVVTFEDEKLPYDISCTFAVSVENGAEIVTFEAKKKSVEISSAGLRKISFGKLLAEAIDFVGVDMKPDGKGSLKGSLLEVKQKRYSEDVIKHATKKRRKNSIKQDEAKRVADYALRLIEQGDPHWSIKTQEAFFIKRATMNRRFELAKFKPAHHLAKRRAKK